MQVNENVISLLYTFEQYSIAAATVQLNCVFFITSFIRRRKLDMNETNVVCMKMSCNLCSLWMNAATFEMKFSQNWMNEI